MVFGEGRKMEKPEFWDPTPDTPFHLFTNKLFSKIVLLFLKYINNLNSGEVKGRAAQGQTDWIYGRSPHFKTVSAASNV